MAMLKKGSSGASVSELQKLLKANGFDPGTIDGVFGPKTDAALRAYQSANGLTADGIYGPKTTAKLTGAAPSSTGSDTTATDAADGDGSLMSVGGDPEVWKVGDQTYLVHITQASDGSQIRLAWIVDPGHVESLYGPGQATVYNKTMNALPKDVLMFGNSTELANMSEDPITTWRNTLETESKTQPWLLDPDYQAKSLMAVLEGRSLSTSEIQQTKWWKENTVGQRNWMTLFHGDPMTAQQRINDGRLLASDMLASAGINNASDDLINFMSDKLIMGEWTQTYFSNQVKAIADPSTGLKVDSGITQILKGTTLNTTQDRELEVRDEVQRWLGPNFGEWDQKTIADWAGKIRNDPDAMVSLIETLKDQRQALFPTYDREATYSTISAPWRQMVMNQWGQEADEADPMFHTIINMNDAAEAGKLLTKEGLKRGNQTVENRVHSDLLASFGGTAR